jgi:hypothetical protein
VIVRDAWFFVNRAAYAMSAQFAYHAKPAKPYFPLLRRRRFHALLSQDGCADLIQFSGSETGATASDISSKAALTILPMACSFFN